MKKFVVSLMSLATLLAPTQVLAQNWVQVSGRMLVDVDSITASRQDRNNIIYREKLFPPNLPGGYIILYRTANCATRGTRVFAEDVYNNAGRVVSRKAVKDGGRYVIPGELGWRVLNLVCK